MPAAGLRPAGDRSSGPGYPWDASSRPRIRGIVGIVERCSSGASADPRDPRRELIKRVAGVAQGRVTLRGDNPVASTDARTFGPVAAGNVRWRVIARYWPLNALGRLPPGPPAPVLSSIEEGGEPACAFPEALIVGD